MTSENLQDFLDTLGLSEKTWYRLESLHSITLDVDGNQFYNPKMQKIYFDSSLQLINLKYYPLKLISGVLNTFTYSISENSITVNRPFGTVYAMKKIKEPVVGDYVEAYDASDTTGTYYYRSEITSITILNGKVKYTLSGTALLTHIATAKRAMRFYIILKSDNEVRLQSEKGNVYTENNLSGTSYPDIYLDLNHICGLDFKKSWGYI